MRNTTTEGGIREQIKKEGRKEKTARKKGKKTKKVEKKKTGRREVVLMTCFGKIYTIILLISRNYG